METPTPLTNDNTSLTPVTEFDGPALHFDFPSLQIGVAEYPEGPTGCTVFYFPQGALAAVDVRGGSYATLFTEHLHHGDGRVHAICLAGGSFYGLEAATGVAAELFAMRGYSIQWGGIALVSGAIIFDYWPRLNSIYPDKALGRAAMRAARPGFFPLGPRGAGSSASAGKTFGLEKGEMAGQGGAYRQLGSSKLAVFTVVNARGAIVNRQGQVVRGHYDRETGTRIHAAEEMERTLVSPGQSDQQVGSTTLTVVVTNRKLAPWPLRQLARQVHSSMARAIQPFHGMTDGDVLYAVTTGEVEEDEPEESTLALAASELAWDAVLNSFEQTRESD
jgi:6-aminohexanoate-oligomer endohydrolase